MIVGDAFGLSPRLRWSIWLFGFVAWTYLLVVPVDWLPDFLRFGGGDKPVMISWGKVGHAMAYATLAALVPLLPVGRSGRLGLWVLLSAHAFGTELAQSFVPTRTGRWYDVVIDHCGIAFGLLLAQLWPREGKPAQISAQQDAGSEDQNADLLRHR